MTETVERAVAPVSAPTSVALDRTLRQRALSLRRPALIVVLLVLASIVIGVSVSTPHAYLDPDGADPQGGRALRVLLENGGVEVTRTTSVDAAVRAASDAGVGTTIVVTDVNNLLQQQLSALFGTKADLVLLNPDADSLTSLVPELLHPRSTSNEARDPLCSVPVATRAGRAYVGGVSYAAAADADVALCYSVDGQGSLAQVRRSDGRLITVLGNGDAFSNGRLADEGNAALGLGLLGADSHLVWVVAQPALVNGQTGDATLTELLPKWIGLALLQVCVLIGLLAVWRGRRFGPVVVERLPVIVRAAEATEGRARLYRRARARDRAAETLRAATRLRLAAVVGVPVVAGQFTVAPEALVSVVAARSGQPPTDIAAVLFGGAPPNDPALVQLADALDSLERTVRHA